MSKLKDLNFNEILSKVNIKFKLVDINRFCTNVELEKKISEAIQNRSEDINQILFENEKDIDIDFDQIDCSFLSRSTLSVPVTS